MHYEEEENQRRSQHDNRGRNRDGQRINDFRSRWDERPPSFQHPRERQWSEEYRGRYQERGGPIEPDFPHPRRQQSEEYHDRRNEHMFDQQPEERHYNRRQDNSYSRDNQHANDRWYQERNRFSDERFPSERRRRSSGDEEEWDDRHR